MGFDAVRALRFMEDLVRIMAPPATPEEICDHGSALTAKALQASGAAIFLLGDGEDGASLKLKATWGESSGVEGVDAAGAAIEHGGVRIAETADGVVERLAIPLPGAPGAGAMGVLVVSGPCSWDGSARAFVLGAAQAVASSLGAAHRLLASHEEGILLVQRNIELETLRELAEALPSRYTEEEALQVALDLVLQKLGLEAGWIFWGESNREELRLAASRGIAEDFVRQARESGIGACLCRDVFATGRLRYARNTTDCPRLPDLVCGSEPMTHACIPLKFERGTMGVMNIANRPGRLFAPAELQFLEIVANQLCLAVDKVRTARAEHRSNAEARALVSLARAIGGSLDLERVLAAVGDYARELLSADRCGIFLGSSPSELEFAYLSGTTFPGLDVGHAVDFVALQAWGIVRALSDRNALVVNNASEDPRVNADLARRWSMGSVVLVPLLSHDRLEGLLVAGRFAPSNWSQEDVTLADALGRHAAVAIENARLFHEAQEALLRLQHAQSGMMRAERLAAVGTLAASLAHEVRNPLNSIHLQLVLLSRRISRLDDPPREELASLVGTAQQEIARLDGLVEDFLSLSSIERLNKSETDLEDVVRDVLLLMGPEAREKGVSVTETFDGSLPRLSIDREKIKQVLINLVRNAIEAMPGGGGLNVATRTVGTAVHVEIVDSGTGIAPGIDVFDFFMTTKRGGTGLGLPIARRIVEAHGGSLTYESDPGRKTVFTVVLRADRKE